MHPFKCDTKMRFDQICSCLVDDFSKNPQLKIETTGYHYFPIGVAKRYCQKKNQTADAAEKTFRFFSINRDYLAGWSSLIDRFRDLFPNRTESTALYRHAVKMEVLEKEADTCVLVAREVKQVREKAQELLDNAKRIAEKIILDAEQYLRYEKTCKETLLKEIETLEANKVQNGNALVMCKDGNYFTFKKVLDRIPLYHKAFEFGETSDLTDQQRLLSKNLEVAFNLPKHSKKAVSTLLKYALNEKAPFANLDADTLLDCYFLAGFWGLEETKPYLVALLTKKLHGNDWLMLLQLTDAPDSALMKRALSEVGQNFAIYAKSPFFNEISAHFMQKLLERSHCLEKEEELGPSMQRS